MESLNRDTEAVLSPNEYLFMAEANGQTQVVTGPIKKPIDSANELMVFDDQTQEFKRVGTVSQAIRRMPVVDESSYVVLHNPAAENKYPDIAGTTSAIPLETGKKVNITGPISFALWPGQIAEVIAGHILRTNQYLIIRVYNAETARENWEDSILKKTGGDDGDDVKDLQKGDLGNGQLYVIKGTEVNFYIPPTGLEVIADENGSFVRDAVTLENLEYCILKNESGEKRYIAGPAVEFPEPDETFESKGSNRIFRGVELNENMGIYVKVTSPYDGHEIGTELFITGKDEKIYMPRPEHAIITYGDKNFIHYAIAIPEGEARYILDKVKGDVKLVEGPTMLLPDPRSQVIVRRILSKPQCNLWYPGNEDVRSYNAGAEAEDLREDFEEQTAEVRAFSEAGMGLPENDNSFEQERNLMSSRNMYSNAAKVRKETRTYKKSHDLISDSMVRGTTYTKPRTITMTEGKFEGAVKIGVWPGFAVQVIDALGDREVIFGPTTRLLDYNDTLEVLELSTGTPKDDERTIKTTYLQTGNNQISDEIEAMTKDMVEVTINVAYLVNFDRKKSEYWFSVSNYVKLLTDRCRSIIINMIKQHNIEDINHGYMNLIRDIILGENKGGEREGRAFENGMNIIDVDVKSLEIDDEGVGSLIAIAQKSSVTNALNVIKAQDLLKATKKIETATQETEDLKHATAKKKVANENEIELGEKAQDALLANEDIVLATKNSEVEKIGLECMKNENQLKIDNEKECSEIRTKEFEAQFKAIQPDLIAALKAAGEMDVAKALAQNIPASRTALHDIFDVGSLSVLMNAVKGTAAEKGFLHLMNKSGENGEVKLETKEE